MSDCNACFYSGAEDLDPPDFLFSKTVVARKVYKCCECGEPIEPGQKYQRVRGKWDEKLDEFKSCLSCAEIREAFSCDGWIYGNLWENITETMFPKMTTGCLEKLTTAAAKAMLLAQWHLWKF
jgi:hypothetical protein